MQFEARQVNLCMARSLRCIPCSPEDKVGIALSTLGKAPINGLRHPPALGTSGWYIWCGEQFSSSPEFFSPLHASHVDDYVKGVIELLGLPPGYRFLMAGDYLDIWEDPNLLAI